MPQQTPTTHTRAMAEQPGKIWPPPHLELFQLHPKYVLALTKTSMVPFRCCCVHGAWIIYTSKMSYPLLYTGSEGRGVVTIMGEVDSGLSGIDKEHAA